MTQQLERRNGKIPNQIWLDIIQRWHTNEMVDRFWDYRQMLNYDDRNHYPVDHWPPIERFIIGNIISFITAVYNNAYSYDHLDTYFYRNARDRLHKTDCNFKEGSKEYDLINSLPDLYELRKGVLGTMSNPKRALMIMDYLESKEFLSLYNKLFGMRQAYRMGITK
jgi:hypothetical protein